MSACMRACMCVSCRLFDLHTVIWEANKPNKFNVAYLNLWLTIHPWMSRTGYCPVDTATCFFACNLYTALVRRTADGKGHIANRDIEKHSDRTSSHLLLPFPLMFDPWSHFMQTHSNKTTPVKMTHLTMLTKTISATLLGEFNNLECINICRTYAAC